MSALRVIPRHCRSTHMYASLLGACKPSCPGWWLGGDLGLFSKPSDSPFKSYNFHLLVIPAKVGILAFQHVLDAVTCPA